MTHTPESLDQIAARIARTMPDDAATLRWCAIQWRRVNRALDEIADDALEQARLAEDAAQRGTIVRFPRMRVGGGVS